MGTLRHLVFSIYGVSGFGLRNAGTGFIRDGPRFLLAPTQAQAAEQILQPGQVSR